MAYRWNATNTARLRSAVRSYNAAITRREKELAAAGLEDYAQFLPKRTTVAETKKRIHDKNDYRRIVGYSSDEKRGRTSELNRILKKNDARALEVIETAEGAITTKYTHDKLRRDKAAKRRRDNRIIRNLGRKLTPADTAFDLDGMSEAEQAAFLNGSGVHLDDGEYDASYDEGYSPQELYDFDVSDAAGDAEGYTVWEYLENWLESWTDPANQHMGLPGFADVVDALQWMAVHARDFLEKLFVTGRDEMDIGFLVVSPSSTGYDDLPTESRHSRVVGFVTDAAHAAGWEG